MRYGKNSELTILGMESPHGIAHGSEVLGAAGIVRAKPAKILTIVLAGRAQAREEDAHVAQVGARVEQRDEVGRVAGDVDLPQAYRAAAVEFVARDAGHPASLAVHDGYVNPGVELMLLCVS